MAQARSRPSRRLENRPTVPSRWNLPCSWKQSISAMEPDGVIQRRATDPRRVGPDVAVLVAKRNAEQQLVIVGNAQLLADDFRKQPARPCSQAAMPRATSARTRSCA